MIWFLKVHYVTNADAVLSINYNIYPSKTQNPEIMKNSDFFIKQSLEYASDTNTEPIRLTIKGEKFFAFECINSDGYKAYLGLSSTNDDWNLVLTFDKHIDDKEPYFETNINWDKDFKAICKEGFKLLNKPMN